MIYAPNSGLFPPLPSAVSIYIKKRGILFDRVLNEVPCSQFFGAVVIPSLAETSNLLQTLKTLSLNPAVILDQFIILVVVNQRTDASESESSDNLETIRMLPEWKRKFGLKNLFWVDAATTGKELPQKQGVGLARKIGLDMSLTLLNFAAGDPLLVCLDADTLVQPDYLHAIVSHFAHSSAGGASIPYRHQTCADPIAQSAIERYELFLRIYVLGLELAGSPYSFHTVGSAMACRASAYVSSGGMNRRLAGEDFYFLQQVHKTSGVEVLSGTIVHPSPRSSNRVPFGTGRAVGDMLAGGEQQLLFYQPVVFSIVGEWLAYVAENSGQDALQLLNGAAKISAVLHDFLKQSGFEGAWKNLKKNCNEDLKLMSAFHGWFDAFRTMRLIHELSNKDYPRIEPETAVSQVIERAGHRSPETVTDQLDLLRRLQGADSQAL